MNAVQRVVVRVDASIEMGMGHPEMPQSGPRIWPTTVQGILPAAQPCRGPDRPDRRRGACRALLPDPEPAGGPAADGTAHARWLPTTWQKDAGQTMEAIDRIGGPVDWLVVDHYALDANGSGCSASGRLASLRSMTLPIGTTTATSCLTRIWCWTWSTVIARRLPPTCRPLLGPAYALLRPEFARRRELLPQRSGKVGRILVCFGGSDPGNETAKAFAPSRACRCPGSPSTSRSD